MKRNFGIIGKETTPNKYYGASGVFDAFDHFVYKKHELWPKVGTLSFTNEDFTGSISATQSTPFYVTENTVIEYTFTLPDTLFSPDQQTYYWRIQHIFNSYNSWFENINGSFVVGQNQHTGTFQVKTNFTGNFLKNNIGENLWKVQVLVNGVSGNIICESTSFSTKIATISSYWSPTAISEGETASLTVNIGSIGTRDNPIPVTISYSGSTAANADFTQALPSSAVFNKGDNILQFSAINDFVVEPNETLIAIINYNNNTIINCGSLLINKTILTPSSSSLANTMPLTLGTSIHSSTPSGWINVKETAYKMPAILSNGSNFSDNYRIILPSTWTSPATTLSWTPNGQRYIYISTAGWIGFQNYTYSDSSGEIRGKAIYTDGLLQGFENTPYNWTGAWGTLGICPNPPANCRNIYMTPDNNIYKKIRFESTTAIWEATLFNPNLIYTLPSVSAPTADDRSNQGFYALKVEIRTGNINSNYRTIKWYGQTWNPFFDTIFATYDDYESTGSKSSYNISENSCGILGLGKTFWETYPPTWWTQHGAPSNESFVWAATSPIISAPSGVYSRKWGLGSNSFYSISGTDYTP